MRELAIGQTEEKILVDDGKYRELKNHRFRLHRHAVYATGPIADLVMGHPPQGKIWDHIDGNPLNNQASNLRLATQRQNLWNRPIRKDSKSCFKGVIREGFRWRARIQCNGRRSNLGSFGTAEEAALAYDTAARELFGEFVRLNFEGEKR